MSSEILKQVVQDLINGRTESAEVAIHQYLVQKTQDIAGINMPTANTPKSETPTEIDIHDDTV